MVKIMMEKKIMGLMVMVFLMTFTCATTAFAASTANQAVSVTVAPTLAIDVDQPTITFGTIPADGVTSTTRSYNVRSQSNVATDMTIIAAALTKPAGTDPLALTDFSWVATGGHTGTLSTASQSLIQNVAKAPKGGSTSVPVSLSVIAPLGSDPGAYSTTITYSIAAH